MLDQIKKFIDEIPTSNEKICFAMGYDAAVNGANEKNCHFSLGNYILDAPKEKK